MKRLSSILLLLSLGFSLHVSAQDRITCLIPSVEEETDYVWRTLQDIAFFEQHNYTVSLPKGVLIDTLVEKSKRNLLSQSDYDALGKFMEHVYQKQAYQAGYEKVKAQYELINRLLIQLHNRKRYWEFKEFPIYTVRLTLYGSGGSYNPEDGSIILFTTSEGEFKQYKNPANTILHEITHMGIEASIVQKYKLPHPLKERIVDTFVSFHFGENLPNYRIQNMGDTRIDSFLRRKKDFRKLDSSIEKYLAEVGTN